MKWNRKRKKRLVTQDENVLKIFFHLGEEDDFGHLRTPTDLQKRRYFQEAKLRDSLQRLSAKGLVMRQDGGCFLTDKGIVEAKRIAKLHRLWEMYMSQFLRIPADHVHEGAESLEHFFTPELEQMLEKELDYPQTDPHDKPIPYTKTQTDGI